MNAISVTDQHDQHLDPEALANTSTDEEAELLDEPEDETDDETEPQPSQSRAVTLEVDPADVPIMAEIIDEARARRRARDERVEPHGAVRPASGPDPIDDRTATAGLLAELTGVPERVAAQVLIAFNGNDDRAEAWIQQQLGAGEDLLPVDVDGSLARARQEAEEMAQPLEELQERAEQLDADVEAHQQEVDQLTAAVVAARVARDSVRSELVHVRRLLARRQAEESAARTLRQAQRQAADRMSAAFDVARATHITPAEAERVLEVIPEADRAIAYVRRFAGRLFPVDVLSFD